MPKRTLAEKPKQADSAPPSRVTGSREAASAAGHTTLALLSFQRAIGNEAAQRVTRVIASSTQAKLTIDTPGDAYEREADRLADRVMRTADPCLHGQDERRQEEQPHSELPMRKRAGAEGPAVVPPAFPGVLRSPGRPLDEATRAYMEPRFGAELDGVRLHTDAAAARSAQSINAQAFTLGANIVFAAGQYKPETVMGKKLLAHELAHVIQQNSPRSIRKDHMGISSIHDSPRVQRIPVVRYCRMERERARILAAHARAIRWLEYAIGRLGNPTQVAFELQRHFMTPPSDSSTIDEIRRNLEDARDEMSGDLIGYQCVPADHEDCVAYETCNVFDGTECLESFTQRYDAFVTTPGSRQVTFCGDLPPGDRLTDRIIHEVMHAKDPGLGLEGYRDIPEEQQSSHRLDRVRSADPYAAFVSDIVHGIFASAHFAPEVGFAEPEPVTTTGTREVAATFERACEHSVTESRGSTRHELVVTGFSRNSASLTADLRGCLDQLLRQWQSGHRNRCSILRIAGYTDGSGDQEIEPELGRSRATAVRDHLLAGLRSRGVPQPQPSRIETQGFNRRLTLRTARGRGVNRSVWITLDFVPQC